MLDKLNDDDAITHELPFEIDSAAPAGPTYRHELPIDCSCKPTRNMLLASSTTIVVYRLIAV